MRFSVAAALLAVCLVVQAAILTMAVDGDWRLISANGLPDHATGAFPNRGNPNRISEQRHDWRIPANPQLAAAPTWMGLGQFGIARNGVVFDAGAAEWYQGTAAPGAARQGGVDYNWQYEAMSGAVPLGLDQNNAHVQPTGTDHYHGVPVALAERLAYRARPALLGWAADGFPIYGPYGYRDARDPSSQMGALRSSYKLREGARSGGPGGRHDGSFVQDYEYVAGMGDLDECNGRRGVTPEFPDGTYYYAITESFPFVPRCFMGAPVRKPKPPPGSFKGWKPKPPPY